MSAAPSVRPFDLVALFTGAAREVLERPWSHLGAQVGYLVTLGGWLIGALFGMLLALLGILMVGLAAELAGLGVDRALQLHGSFALPFASLVQVVLDATGELLSLVVTAATLPVVATLRLGLHRDLARHAGGGARMGLASSFRWPFWRFGVVAAIGLLSPILAVGALLIPLVGVPLAFLAPTMAIRDVGAVEAARIQLAALTRDPGRFLVLACASCALTGLGWSIPVIGPALALAFQHRAAREVLAVAPAAALAR